MIKRLIFDIDNTLIRNVTFENAIKKTLKEIKLKKTEKEMLLIEFIKNK